MIKELVRVVYEQEFHTSVSDREIGILIAHNCDCDNCGDSIFGMDDFPNVKKGEVLCENCYRDKYMLDCPICENYFYKALKPKDEVIIISKEAVEQYGMEVKPGFYRVIEWPYHYGNIVTGFEGLYNNSIKLIKELDINSMLYKLQPHNGTEKVSAGECCHDCMKKYTGQSKIINNYVDKKYGRQWIKLLKEVIALGK